MPGANGIKISYDKYRVADSRRMSVNGSMEAVKTAHQLIAARYQTTRCDAVQSRKQELFYWDQSTKTFRHVASNGLHGTCIYNNSG